jgi:hypothetical protein
MNKTWMSVDVVLKNLLKILYKSISQSMTFIILIMKQINLIVVEVMLLYHFRKVLEVLTLLLTNEY